MIAVSLVHIAILTSFAVAHAAGTHIDFHAAFKGDNAAETRVNGWRWPDETTEPTVEKVVLRDTTLSEICGLGERPNAPLDEDTTALADKARRFASSIDWIAKRKDLPPAMPDLPIRANWTKRFAVQWDDDGGFSLGGKYFPKSIKEIETPLSSCGGGLDLRLEFNR
jgi:hypothetical protein